MALASWRGISIAGSFDISPGTISAATTMAAGVATKEAMMMWPMASGMTGARTAP